MICREEDDEYEDDDDVSWKVRRASAKCLAAILGSRPELLTSFYHTVSPVLIAQFKGLIIVPSLMIIMASLQNEKRMSRQTFLQHIKHYCTELSCHLLNRSALTLITWKLLAGMQGLEWDSRDGKNILPLENGFNFLSLGLIDLYCSHKSCPHCISENPSFTLYVTT